MSDFKVNISYKNKQLQTVVEREYDLENYTSMIKGELMVMLGDIEAAFSCFQNNKTKDEWDDEAKAKFQAIRHKLLDQANAIERLPSNISFQGMKINSIKFSKILADILNNQ